MRETPEYQQYAKELAKLHWGYVEEVLRLHNEQEDIVEKCGFHYQEAMQHGFKHGVEYALSTLAAHD